HVNLKLPRSTHSVVTCPHPPDAVGGVVLQLARPNCSGELSGHFGHSRCARKNYFTFQKNGSHGPRPSVDRDPLFAPFDGRTLSFGAFENNEVIVVLRDRKLVSPRFETHHDRRVSSTSYPESLSGH